MASIGCRVGEVWTGQHQIAKFLMGAPANNERITTLRQTAERPSGVPYFTGQISTLDPAVDKTKIV